MSLDYLTSLFSLTGRTVLVTGASRGIGREIALGMARAGADLIAVARDGTALEDLAREIRPLGRNVTAAPCDLATPGAIRQLFDDIGRRGVRPDVLVNNASIIKRCPPQDISEEEWDEVINLNLRASFFMAQEAGKLMIGNGYGKIIQIASVLGFGGGPNVTSYAVSKGGLISMTKALAAAWAKHGVRVNAIAPGYTKTRLTDPLYDDEKTREALTQRIPLGRWAMPEEIVGAALFLAGPASDYVTGHTIAVDGGWLAS
jgi:2-deoxy-D-gluconate 3-dehydrogenase